MFYYLTGFKEILPGFNIFRYITFRASMAAVTAFVLCVILAPICIRYFKALRIRENAKRQDAPGLDRFGHAEQSCLDKSSRRTHGSREQTCDGRRKDHVIDR